MYKCKQNLNPPVFCGIFTHRTKTKYALQNENSIQEILCRINFSQYWISYHGPNLWNKVSVITISSNRLNMNLNNSFYLNNFLCLCSSALIYMHYSIFVSFKHLVNFIGICSIIDFIVVWLKLMEKKTTTTWQFCL